MRVVLIVVLATFIQFISVETAEARRGGGSKSQELHFVAPTTIPGPDGADISLCHLSTKSHVIEIGLWRSMDGYALSSTECEGDQFFPFSAEQFAEAQAGGFIPADLPAEPKMTLAMMASGFYGTGILGLLAAFAGFKFLGSRRRRKERHAGMGNIDPYHRMLLDVMCHAAVSDGHVEASEVALIRKIALDLTGQEFSPETIAKMVKSCDKSLTPAQYKAFGKGMDMQQRATAVKAALMVISADNELAAKEKKFVNGLAAGLNIPEDLMQRIVQGG